MTRYDVDTASQLAEIAFVVRDDWQRCGVGSFLMKRMAEIAHAKGLAGFSADVLATNKAMLLVFHRCGLDVRTQLDSGVYHVEARFPQKPDSTAAPP
jgi:GNAT superfamily N-acetyltransferase